MTLPQSATAASSASFDVIHSGEIATPLHGVHDGAAVDVFEHLRLEHEEGPVDPALGGLGLLGELDDAVPVEHQVAEARGGAHGGDGRELAVRAVEREQLVEVDVRDAVSPGQHERLVAQERAEALDATAGQGVATGLDQVEAPLLLLVPVALDAPLTEVDGEVPRERGVVGEVLLDGRNKTPNNFAVK